VLNSSFNTRKPYNANTAAENRRVRMPSPMAPGANKYRMLEMSCGMAFTISRKKNSPKILRIILNKLLGIMRAMGIIFFWIKFLEKKRLECNEPRRGIPMLAAVILQLSCSNLLYTYKSFGIQMAIAFYYEQ